MTIGTGIAIAAAWMAWAIVSFREKNTDLVIVLALIAAMTSCGVSK